MVVARREWFPRNRRIHAGRKSIEMICISLVRLRREDVHSELRRGPDAIDLSGFVIGLVEKRNG